MAFSRTRNRSKSRRMDPFWALVVLACVALVFTGLYFRYFSGEAVSVQLAGQWGEIEQVVADNDREIKLALTGDGGPQLDVTVKRENKLRRIEGRLERYYIRDDKLKATRDDLLRMLKVVEKQTEIAGHAAEDPGAASLKAEIQNSGVPQQLAKSRAQVVASAKASGYPMLAKPIMPQD